MWGCEREGREKLQGSRLTGFDDERRRQWRHGGDSCGQPGGSRLDLFGAKRRRCRGVYIGCKDACDCVRIKPDSVRIWLGFHRWRIRVHHVEDGDDRWVPHVSEREREMGWAGVACCVLRCAGERRWARPK